MIIYKATIDGIEHFEAKFENEYTYSILQDNKYIIVNKNCNSECILYTTDFDEARKFSRKIITKKILEHQKQINILTIKKTSLSN